MSRYGLDELKKLALPALGHSELIKLARTCSPSQTLKLAREAKWPKRQVEAARSLALLRRDFPGRVFDDFLTTNEQIRTGQPVTGSLRGAGMDRLDRSLALLSDPRKKMELMLEHGLIDKAVVYLTELVETATVFFDFNHNEGSLCYEDVAKRDDEKNLSQIMIVAHHRPEHRVGGLRSDELQLDLMGFIQRLGDRANEIMDPLALKIVKKAVACDAIDGETSYVAGTILAARYWWTSIPAELLQTVEVWQLRYFFQKAEVDPITYWGLPPNYWQSSSSRDVVKNADNYLSLMNRVVDRFTELGWDMQQIRQEFLAWLRNERHVNYSETLVYAVSAAKCFAGELDEDRYLALRPYLPHCWDSLVKGHKNYMNLAFFLKLGSCELYRTSVSALYYPSRPDPIPGRPEDKAFFRLAFAELLAAGRIAFAYQLMLMAGQRLGFSIERHGLTGALDNSEYPKAVRQILGRLASKAFDAALAQKEFGIAGALSQHFDCINEPELRREILAALKLELQSVIGDPWDATDEAEDSMYTAKVLVNPRDVFDIPRDDPRVSKIKALKAKFDQSVADRIAARKRQIAETIETALDLMQPIKLEAMEYVTLE
jgi:hypothetical protein